MLSTATQHGAVQVVMLASAGLSAACSASQAPSLPFQVAGYAVELFLAIGLGVTAFALDMVKPKCCRSRGSCIGPAKGLADARSARPRRQARRRERRTGRAARRVPVLLVEMAQVVARCRRDHRGVAGTAGS